MKKLFFLSGFPRSGSTVLGSILSQHPKIHVTPTSPLFDLVYLIEQNFKRVDVQYTYDKKNMMFNIYKSIFENVYNHVDKSYIIDKHRAWPKNLRPFKQFTNQEPKVICTNRRISEIIVSFISLVEQQPDNYIDNELRRFGEEINNENRARILWEKYVSDAYNTIMIGIENFRDNIYFVDYNELVDKPFEILNGIYKFLEIDGVDHNFENIENKCAEEKDSAWGLENLHKIRSKLGRTNRRPEEVIGEVNVEFYDRYNIVI